MAQPVTPSPIPEEETPEALPTEEPEATPKPRKRAPANPDAILSADDRASFQRLAASLGGESGLAVSGVGLGRPVERVGALRGGSAWSTAKVPIAMAVVDAGGQATQQTDLAQAITASDNAAATRLWTSLGPPETAAEAANAQLRAAGDTRTNIESRPLLASYTPFGQTGWSLRDQAKFAAGMPCTAAGVQVLGLMGQVVGGQQWGLGATGPEAAVQGRLGPGVTPRRRRRLPGSPAGHRHGRRQAAGGLDRHRPGRRLARERHAQPDRDRALADRARQRRRSARRAELLSHDAVAAAALGGVEPGVGERGDVVEALGLARAGDPDARGHRQPVGDVRPGL